MILKFYIFRWLSANKLTLSINKTKYKMFASNKKRILVNDSSKLGFYRKPIERVESISFLGIKLYNTKFYYGNLTFLHCYKKLGAI